MLKERGGNELAHAGRTDARGRATVTGLAPNTWLVETARRVPHATGFAGVWLTEDETRALTVRVGRGGSVSGRTVDETGRPLAGLEVTLSPSPMARRIAQDLRPSEVAATTGADGRFEIPHVLRSPRDVWIVEGRERPTSYDPTLLTFRSPAWPGWRLESKLVRVPEGGRYDLGDVVIEREVELFGRVVDGAGRPVAGALVSVNPKRSSARASVRPEVPLPLPGDVPRVLPAEALTDAEGRFRLTAPHSPRLNVLVSASDGRRTKQRVETLLAGEERRVELVLAASGVLTLELVGEDGARLARDGQLESPDGYRRRGFGRPPPGSVEVVVVTEDGGRQAAMHRPDDDGLVRATVEAPLEHVRSVDVQLWGYRSAFLPLPDGLADGEPLRVELQPLDRVDVRVRWTEGDAEGAPANVTLNACRLGPDHLDPPRHLSRCCGFGGGRRVLLGVEPLDVALLVQGAGPWWVYVDAGARPRYLPTRVLGPFATAGGTVEVELARRDFVPPERPYEEPTEPPPEPQDETGQGYTTASPMPVFPRFVARLVCEDGSALQTGSHVQASTGHGAIVREGGKVVLNGKLPPSFDLAIDGLELVRVDGWTPAVEQILSVGPRFPVEVVVGGVRSEWRAVLLSLRAEAEEGAWPHGPGNGWRGSRGRGLEETGSSEPGIRRWRAELLAGRYVLRSYGSLLGIDPVPIEVRAVDGVQRFEAVLRER